MAYATSGTDSVQWTFDSVNSVFEILEDSIVPGVEVYSRYLRASEVESLKLGLLNQSQSKLWQQTLNGNRFRSAG